MVGQKVYSKPTMSLVELDKALCDVVEIPCGVTGTFTTSTSSYREYQICVHYPEWSWEGYNFKYVYSKNNGEVRYLRIKGEHAVSFLGPDPSAYCNDNIKDGDAGGCGWQQYGTSGNGGCHYFGRISIDGVEIGQGTSLSQFGGEVREI